MAIYQENRLNVPSPEVKDTGYGVKYVNAGTEKPVVEGQPKEEIPETAEEPVSEPERVETAPKRVGRRTRKAK